MSDETYKLEVGGELQKILAAGAFNGLPSINVSTENGYVIARVRGFSYNQFSEQAIVRLNDKDKGFTVNGNPREGEIVITVPDEMASITSLAKIRREATVMVAKIHLGEAMKVLQGHFGEGGGKSQFAEIMANYGFFKSEGPELKRPVRE